MAKADKDFELRMSGMLAAYNIAKEKGIEGLEKEIKWRGILKVPVNVPESVIQDLVVRLGENLYTTILTVVLMALEDLGWREKRLKRFKELYDKETACMYDMNWLGNHFVTMTDHAKHLKDEYGIELDTVITDKCQELADAKNPDYKFANIDRLIEHLAEKGFVDAAEYLKGYWEKY